MNRLTIYYSGYAHGAEGITEDSLTGHYCRGEYEATAVTERLAKYEDYNELRPLEEWDESYGTCLFWKIPTEEPPYCGSPLDLEWNDGNYTHFTRIPMPISTTHV